MSGDGKLIRAKLAFERNFTQIPNDWMRDPKLSLKARGLLGLLMSHDEGYTVTFRSLAAQNREGDSAIRTAVAELKAAGYLEVRRERGRHGQIIGSIWQLTDPAEVAKRKRVNRLDIPALDSPGVDQPRVDNPHLDNQRLKEEQLQEHSTTRESARFSTRAGVKESDLDELEHTCPITHSAHIFDHDSGWCIRCDQVRDDGQINNLNGTILRKPRSAASA